MKYIKTFEDGFYIKDVQSYNFGDYVYVDQDKNHCAFKRKDSDELEPYCLIKAGNSKLFDRIWDYQVESYNFVRN